LAAGVGVAVGDGLGDAVGEGLGLGVGVGALNALPSKLPGFVESGTVGVDAVAFEENAIHRPSLLMTGRVFTISTLTLLKVAVFVGSNRTLLVSVIWNIRRWA
jgi:hypothetical protein